MSEPTPHMFLVEDDFDGVEWVRRLAHSQFKGALHQIDQLRESVDGREARMRLDALEGEVRGLKRWLVAAFEARTAQLNNEALGYVPPE